MIATITKGKGFSGCIRYCLTDKKELSEEQKRELSEKDQLQHKDRAEVLYYNKCFGDAKELARDFREVGQLSSRVEKPVLHVSLRLAPGEQLSKAQWIDAAQECARALGIEDNQYLCVQHKDTKEQHIHIIANRVGFNGKAVSDSKDYKKMDSLCRKLEHQYNLRQVLSPRSFLATKDRQEPRRDLRKEKLQQDIRQTLEKVGSYAEFEKEMKALGYSIIKSRGISFMDNKKVKTKGSEVGFSLAKIEKILNIKDRLAEMNAQREGRQRITHQSRAATSNTGTSQTSVRAGWSPTINHFQTLKFLTKTLETLLEPVESYDHGPGLSEEEKRRRRKRGMSR